MIPVKKARTILEDKKFRSQIADIYGDEENTLSMQAKRYINLVKLFSGEFPTHENIRFFSAPGRTEIAGNHTDHQHGHVICASVDMDIIAAVSPNGDNIIRLKSEGYDKTDIIDLSNLSPVEEEKFSSAALIRGIAAGFTKKGYKIGGFDAYTTSRVPKGSGLSSSAAFEILVAVILNYLYNVGKVDSITMAIISRYSENEFFGKPCGLMDQCGCSVGKVMTIDFNDPLDPVVDSLDIDFEKYGYSLIITNTGGSHADLNDDYSAITEDMGQVAKALGENHLRYVSEKSFISLIPKLREKISDKAILRAMHFFSDDRRVIDQTNALKSSEIDKFVRLVGESGISSWTRLQNIYSTKHPDVQPIALALSLSEKFLSGQGASRVHGGGFAGTIQAFVPNEKASEYIKSMSEVFGNDSCVKIRIRNVPAGEV